MRTKRFNVCFLNTRFFPIGGTASRTLGFAKAIKDKVKKVQIVTWQRSDDYPLPNKITDYRRESIFIDILKIKHPFFKRHFRFLYLSMLGLEYFFFVRKATKESEIDIIQCCHETFWMSILLKKVLKKPLIADIHAVPFIPFFEEPSNNASGLSHFLSKVFLKMEDKFVDRFLCPTEELRDFLVSSGIPFEKIKIVTNAIFIPKTYTGQSRAKIRNELGLDEKTVVVAFHGILNTNYNFNTVLYLSRISRIVHQRLNGKVRFLIMGYYDEVPVRNEDFIYTGYVDNLAEYLSAADFAVVPIFDNSLGMRSRLLDYISMSLPVLTTSVGVTGMKFVRDSGAVIVRDDIKELADSVIELACSSEKLEEMAQKSKKLIECFSPEKIAEDLLSLYGQVIQN